MYKAIVYVSSEIQGDAIYFCPDCRWLRNLSATEIFNFHVHSRRKLFLIFDKLETNFINAN